MLGKIFLALLLLFVFNHFYNPINFRGVPKLAHERVVVRYMAGGDSNLEALLDPRWKPDPASLETLCKSEDPILNTILMVTWFDNILEPILSVKKRIESMTTCKVINVGTLHKENLQQHLFDKMVLARFVVFWNWKIPIDVLSAVRLDFPNAIWLMHNWDDPYTTMVTGETHDYRQYFQIVYTSGTSTLATYVHEGTVLEAQAFMPPFDDIHYPDYNQSFVTDVAFVGTQPYSRLGLPRNRTAVFEELISRFKSTKYTFHIYGTPAVGEGFPENYKGKIGYDVNRRVFTNAKINLNLHVVDSYGPEDSWYVNLRNTEVLSSKGLLLVDKTARGVLKDGEAVFLNSNRPKEIVDQIVDILENYQDYEAVKERGYQVCMQEFSPEVHALRLADSLNRVGAILPVP